MNSTPETGRRSDEAATGTPAAAPSVQASSVIVGAAAEADGLRGYRLALAAEARRFKRYPERAREAGWNGTAEVRVEVTAAGQAQPPELLKPSGHGLLDEAAIDMLRQAASATPVPDILRNRAFHVDLPVVFELPD